MNTYTCFYRGKKIKIVSDTTYHAQIEAAKQFKAKKTYDISVVLSEKDGKQVTHIADF